MKYLFFDLDGTLTESKKDAEPYMLAELDRLSQRYNLILVSGAELARMTRQIPRDYFTLLTQNGNQVYENGEILWKNELVGKEKIYKHIDLCLKELNMVVKEDMIEDRGSQISVSFIGHNAPTAIKKLFDPTRNVRADILDKFPFPGSIIGGTTCIEYIPYTKGDNIKRYIELKGIFPHECLYIGDAFMRHGNDATVLGVIPIHQVCSPLDTFNFIKYL